MGLAVGLGGECWGGVGFERDCKLVGFSAEWAEFTRVLYVELR